MAENFQDNVSYGGSTLAVSGDAIAVGSTNANAKSVIFNNSGSQGHLAWQPTANRTVFIPDLGGTVQLTGQVPGAIYDGANSISTGTIRFTNANGVSFSINGQTISASVAAQSAQTQSLIQAVYDGANSITTGTIRFTNANGVSFSINGQTISASIAVQSVQTEGMYAIGNTVGQSSSSTFDARTMSISGAGIASVGYSGNALVISVPSGAALINFSAGTTSNNLGAVTFSNSNGVSFGLNGSTITGSIAAQTAQTVGLYALGNTTQNSSTTLDARTLSFNGLGAATVGYSNGFIQVSVPIQTAQTQSLIQAIYDGANSITTGTIRFTNANGVSFSINGQTISGSVAAQTAQTVGLYALGNTTQNSSTTLDARTLSFNGLGAITVGYSNGSVQISAPNNQAFQLLPDSPWQTNFSISNASQSLQHFIPKNKMIATQANFLMALNGHTNSTGALTISFGAYTMSGSTMSLASSTSRQITWTSGAATNSSSVYGGISGTCYRTMSLPNWAFTVGNYMLGIWCRTTNDGNWMMFGSQGPTIVNAQDVNETQFYANGIFSSGSYSTAMVVSINLTDATNYIRTGGPVLQQPSFVLIGTV